MSAQWQRRFNRIRARIVGASLIEVLIAFAVLALGITSIVSFQGTLTQNSDQSKARTEAAALGEKKLEELRNYASLASFDAITNGSDTQNSSNHTYTRTWTVTDSTTYKTIALAVTWQDRNQNSSDNVVNLNTVIARVDPAQTILTVQTSSTSSTTGTSTSSTTGNSTTSTIASSSTTTITTSTSAGSTTTAASTTTTASSTTTTSTTANTPTTTVACRCERVGNSTNYDALDYVSDPENPYHSCTDSCCGNSPLKCLTRDCSFTAYCPL